MLPGIYDQGPESIGSRDVWLAVLPVRRKTFLRSYRLWGLMIVVGIVAVVLGYVKLIKYFAAAGEHRSALDLVYMIFCLFAVETGYATGSVPWELSVARVLAPLLSAWVLYRAAMIEENMDDDSLVSCRDLGIATLMGPPA